MKLSLLALAGIAVVAAACSKDDPKSTTAITSATLPGTPAAVAPAAPAAAGPLVVKIPKLGLKGLAPGETETPLMGDGDPVMIMLGRFAVTVSAAKASDPKKIKDGLTASKMFNPKNTKQETLADGWALTYENTGSAGANYFVSTRRDIAGKGYLCETTANTPDQQQLALAFCKSLSN